VIMKSEILKALVSALGGEGEELFKEFDKFSNEYPNLTILMTDVVRNGALLAQEMSDANAKIEILKDLLLEANVIKAVHVNDPNANVSVDMLGVSANPLVEGNDEEININEIIWQHTGDDGDLPN